MPPVPLARQPDITLTPLPSPNHTANCTPAGNELLYSNFKRRPGEIRGVEQPIGPIQFEPYGRR